MLRPGFYMTLDATSRAVLEVIHQAGFTTTVVRLDGVYHRNPLPIGSGCC